jgi:hypothetical protein
MGGGWGGEYTRTRHARAHAAAPRLPGTRSRHKPGGFPAIHRWSGDDGYAKETHQGSASSCRHPATTRHTI